MSYKCHIVFLQCYYHFLLGFLFFDIALCFLPLLLFFKKKKNSVVLSPLILYFIMYISILPLLRRLANLFSREKEEEGLSRWLYKHVTPASGSLSWGSLRVDEVGCPLPRKWAHCFPSLFYFLKKLSHAFSFNDISRNVSNSNCLLWLGNQQKPNSPTRFCEKFTLTKHFKVFFLQFVFFLGVGPSMTESDEGALCTGPVRWPRTCPDSCV